VYPAIYLASAALIITAIFWYQTAGSNSAKDQFKKDGNELLGQNPEKNPAVEVGKVVEDFKMPVEKPELAKVEMGFYDAKASKKQQEAAMVVYGSTYSPNRGIDIGMKDGKEFKVVAAMSGTVTKVTEDAMLGNVIEIQHSNGVVTDYQSVKDFQVNVGDVVKQGDVLATAGNSQISEKEGVHVHFEIRKDNVAVNPTTYFGKPVSAIQEDAATDNTNAGSSSDQSSKSDSTQKSNPSNGQDTNSKSQDSNSTTDTNDSQG
jgi:stage II sporulation protein Q